jgi:hypothetical protein
MPSAPALRKCLLLKELILQELLVKNLMQYGKNGEMIKSLDQLSGNMRGNL